MGSSYSLFMYPDVTPMGDSAPTFDPLYGFPNGRKERKMLVTEQEFIANKVPHEFRDYCAHHYLKLEECKRWNLPWTVKCGREVHNWNVCAFEDYEMRMKEYERERRLLVRAKRKREAELKAAKEMLAA